jgi:hypothetical protein
LDTVSTTTSRLIQMVAFCGDRSRYELVDREVDIAIPPSLLTRAV